MDPLLWCERAQAQSPMATRLIRDSGAGARPPLAPSLLGFVKQLSATNTMEAAHPQNGGDPAILPYKPTRTFRNKRPRIRRGHAMSCIQEFRLTHGALNKWTESRSRLQGRHTRQKVGFQLPQCSGADSENPAWMAHSGLEACGGARAQDRTFIGLQRTGHRTSDSESSESRQS